MKLTRRTFALGLPAALSACTIAASGGRTRSHVLRYCDGLDVTTLNPLLSTTSNISFLSQLAMAMFVRFDHRGNPVPELVTDIPSRENGGISADGRTLTWHLRRNVRWSDGAPFGAGDVIFTVNAIGNPANIIPNRSAWDQIKDVRALDEYTVEFRLKGPFAPFYDEFFSSFGGSCVLPKHLLGSSPVFNESPYNALPVGIGPFRYKAFRRADAVELEANPYYFRGRPRLHRIVYKIITNDNTAFAQLESGEIDLLVLIGAEFFERVKRLPGKRVQSVLSPFVSGIYFNVSRPVLRDRAVRQALRFATDRNLAFDKVFHRSGLLVESVVAQIARESDKSLPLTQFDPARAQALLDAAGWKRRADGTRWKDGEPLTIRLVIPAGYSPSASSAEILRQGWSQVGVQVDLHAYDSGKYFAPYAEGGILQTGNFDAALLSVSSSPSADLTNFYGCAYAPPHGFNFMRYCNRSVDAGLERYVSSYDAGPRFAAARRYQRQIDDDAPVIVLYERANVCAYNEALTGFRPQAVGFFDDVMDLDI